MKAPQSIVQKERVLWDSRSPRRHDLKATKSTSPSPTVDDLPPMPARPVCRVQACRNAGLATSVTAFSRFDVFSALLFVSTRPQASVHQSR